MGPHEMKFGAIGGPRFLRRVVPQYPMVARERGREGSVLLQLTIDARGKLLAASVLDGTDTLFQEAALKAVRQSTFLPARLDGVPVTCRVTLPVRFALRGGEDE